ncbi:efflux RND transporter periplasmic adaptor subunit [Pontibacter sp. G13]|uniref:efflux RND transporter periplasmic adaptor subunit n=1 Tax=Pontibacter sp. G13 TaxID=3074898 RepID=UPI00288C4027|nr:efflux RND transporter periplasmic adaptor subunit [Pontibacter sp. G13]WNJ17521.1 efflux RND transporter periplasmic adaptor subunit [Pontibacter sp. G13]
MRYLTFWLAAILCACQPKMDHGHSHAHSGGGAHGHDHGPATTIKQTIHTHGLELFVEFPPLVKGKISPLAAHITQMDGYRPVASGKVTATLIQGESGIRHQVDAPNQPGIFKPALKPQSAGKGNLSFLLEVDGETVKFDLGSVEVFENMTQAEAWLAHIPETPDAISLTLEQAWQLDFAIEQVIETPIFEVIPTTGTWKTAPKSQSSITAVTSGEVTYRSDLVAIGQYVQKGQNLLSIDSEDMTSGNLKAKIQQAQIELEHAASILERKRKLRAAQIVPKSELEEAEHSFELAQSRLETLEKGYAPGGKRISAPISGYISDLSVDNGGFVQQGHQILTISDQQSSRLEVYASPYDAASLANLQDIFHKTPGGKWSSVVEGGGSISSVGNAVSSERPQLTILAEVRSGVTAPTGSVVEAQLAIGSGTAVLTVPTSALLEEYGTYTVMVQLDGESYARKVVQIGRRNGERTEILSGLKQGDWVVSQSAYAVKMAANAGQSMGHGHVH